MPPSKYRTVIHEAQFKSELEFIESEFWKAEEFIQGVEWIVARDPLTGARIVTAPAIRALYTNLGKDLKPVIVYYTFTNDEVFLLSIRAATPTDSP